MMANTPTVTKENVSQLADGAFSVSIRMVVNDGATDIVDTIVSSHYDPSEPDLGAVEAKLQKGLKDVWDKYTAEQDKFNAVVFDNMISSVQAAADAYIT